MVRKKIPTIEEPPLGEILIIKQREFGYLSPEVKKKYIETVGMGPCIGVYVRDSDRQLQALAHIDANRQGYSNQTNQFLAYLKNKKLTDGGFDEVLILKSQLADERGVNEINYALKMRGYERIEIIDGDRTIHVIFDKKGDMYWIDPKTIKAEEKSDAEWKSFDIKALIRDGLECVNTGEIVKDQIDPLYPGLDRTFHSVGRYGVYGVRIPVRENFDKRILNELKQDGLSLSLNKCKYGTYVTIAKYGYPVSEDRKVVRQVNRIAANLFEKIATNYLE